MLMKFFSAFAVGFLSLVLMVACSMRREQSQVESLSYRCTATKFKTGDGGIFVNLTQRSSAGAGSAATRLAEMAQIRLTQVGSSGGDVLWNIPAAELVPQRGSLASAPQGRYKIAQLTVTSSGVKHILIPTTELQSTIFTVHQNCISNLGEWAIDLKPQNKIRLDSKLSQPSFRLAAQRAGVDGAAVLDAYKPDDFPDLDVDDTILTTIAKVKRSRMISMHYRIDVTPQPTLARKLLPAVKARDVSMRACYSGRLDAQPKLRGSVTMKFKWIKPTGKLSNVNVAGGDLRDQQVTTCLGEELQQIVVATPRSVQGTIKFVFDAKEGAPQQVATLPDSEL